MREGPSETSHRNLPSRIAKYSAVAAALLGVSMLATGMMQRLLRPSDSGEGAVATMKPADAPKPAIVDLNEPVQRDDLLDCLRRGDILLVNRKFIKVQRIADGEYGLNVGFEFPIGNPQLPGNLYQFADKMSQQKLNEYMNDKRQSPLTIGSRIEMDLLKKLKVKNPSDRKAFCFRLSIDSGTLRAIDRDQFILPIAGLDESLRRLSNAPGSKKDVEITIMGFTPEGVAYNHTMSLRRIEEADPNKR